MTENKRIIIFSFFWLAAMALMARQIEPRLFSAKLDKSSGDPLSMMLGSAKEAIGDAFFLKASSYFHGGVDNDLIEHEEAFGSHEAHDEEEHLESFKKSYSDWVYRINSQIKVMEHRHLEGEELKEMLPFLKAAVSLDPYNVSAVLTTAYWLNDYFKKTDDALEILQEGFRKNPDSWEIGYQLGLSYFKNKKDYAKSVFYFERSLNLMKNKGADNITCRMIAYYLGESYLEQGLREKALGSFQRALTYFDKSENLSIRSQILDKIRNLSS